MKEKKYLNWICDCPEMYLMSCEDYQCEYCHSTNKGRRNSLTNNKNKELVQMYRKQGMTFREIVKETGIPLNVIHNLMK